MFQLLFLDSNKYFFLIFAYLIKVCLVAIITIRVIMKWRVMKLSKGIETKTSILIRPKECNENYTFFWKFWLTIHRKLWKYSTTYCVTNTLMTFSRLKCVPILYHGGHSKDNLHKDRQIIPTPCLRRITTISGYTNFFFYFNSINCWV